VFKQPVYALFLRQTALFPAHPAHFLGRGRQKEEKEKGASWRRKTKDI